MQETLPIAMMNMASQGWPTFVATLILCIGSSTNRGALSPKSIGVFGTEGRELMSKDKVLTFLRRQASLIQTTLCESSLSRIQGCLLKTDRRCIYPPFSCNVTQKYNITKSRDEYNHVHRIYWQWGARYDDLLCIQELGALHHCHLWSIGDISYALLGLLSRNVSFFYVYHSVILRKLEFIQYAITSKRMKSPIVHKSLKLFIQSWLGFRLLSLLSSLKLSMAS